MAHLFIYWVLSAVFLGSAFIGLYLPERLNRPAGVPKHVPGSGDDEIETSV